MGKKNSNASHFSSVREEDCSAAVQRGLHRAIRTLEGAHRALCYFLERLLAKDMSTRQQHWWILCCALLPRYRASKERVENELAPQLQLLHCVATSSRGKELNRSHEFPAYNTCLSRRAQGILLFGEGDRYPPQAVGSMSESPGSVPPLQWQASATWAEQCCQQLLQLVEGSHMPASRGALIVTQLIQPIYGPIRLTNHQRVHVELC